MKHKWLWIVAGIVSLAGGVLALMNPFAATLVAELLTGASFLISGVLTIVGVFRREGAAGKLVALGIGVVMTLMGLVFLGYPLFGVVSLTAAIGVMLAIAGGLRLVFAFKIQGSGRWVMIGSGVVALLLAYLIFSHFEAATVLVLGTYLAIELISNGISLISVAYAEPARSTAHTPESG